MHAAIWYALNVVEVDEVVTVVWDVVEVDVSSTMVEVDVKEVEDVVDVEVVEVVDVDVGVEGITDGSVIDLDDISENTNAEARMTTITNAMKTPDRTTILEWVLPPPSSTLPLAEPPATSPSRVMKSPT